MAISKDQALDTLGSNHAEMYMNDNATETTISVVDTPVKIEGTTTEGVTSANWTHTNGRLTYNGLEGITVLVTVSMSVIAAANSKEYTYYVALNGSVTDKTKIKRKQGTGSDVGAVSVCGTLNITENDYVEIFVECNSDTTNMTVENINVSIS